MNLVKFILIFIVAITLQARENPFVATEAYIEEKSILEEKLQETIKPFEFLQIALYAQKCILNISNHKLFRYFKITKEKKIVLDYKGSKKIITKIVKPKSNGDIKSITIADHPEENYFRIVIQYHKNIDKHNIEYENNLTTINF